MLAAGLVIAAVVDLPSHGIAVVGDVKGGLPPFGLPDVGLKDFRDLLLPAAAFALVAFADLIATVRTFAQQARLRRRREPRADRARQRERDRRPDERVSRLLLELPLCRQRRRRRDGRRPP